MNQQPQTGPAGQPADDQSFYHPSGAQPPTASYAGYDLTDQTPVQNVPHGDQTISWQASEYIHHSKGLGWIIGLAVVTAVLVGVAIWLGVWTFAVLVVVMAIAIGVVAFRPPRVLHYTLNDQGLQVDQRFYTFSDFRAFGILDEGAFYTIMLLPTKRFMPAINVFFAEQDGEKIVDVLGSRLPLEQLRHDSVEKLMRRLRF
jgi:hypothetical protein